MKVVYVDSVGSTNDEIWKLPESPLAFIAKRQISGKGTRGKFWVSEEGNFYGSFKQSYKNVEIESFPSFSVLAGIRIIQSLKNQVQENLKLMWPNDLVIDLENSYKKVGGILCESKIQGDSIELVVGVGINVKHVPDHTDKPAGKIDISLEVLQSIMVNAFQDPLNMIEMGEFSKIDFFSNKKIKLPDGEIGIGCGIGADFKSYRVKTNLKERLIVDPDRPLVYFD